MERTATETVGHRTKAPLKRLPFTDWKEAVGKVLHEICADGFTLKDVPQSFDFQKLYDEGSDILEAAEKAYEAIWV